ncbi:uncharacterized protein LOC128197669 [Vigna angularis]|nr:uncharacterized protein LOC128193580 [Vigna angularis]XP_052735808.1 uncharacterized protein LOC128197667 [Vigna angularis]XP_052735809.1 uncharacterized protein LOC128197668 [Vigna angularis]XP_052735810.1 uncharacterized protein LOC128197669 [Vigna angularis]
MVVTHLFDYQDAIIGGAFYGKLCKVWDSFFGRRGRERGRATKGREPFLPFSPVQRAPMGSCSNLGRGLEEDLSWASGDDGVLASRAGKGSEELLKFLEDLDLHVWEEIDPKTYMEVFKS